LFAAALWVKRYGAKLGKKNYSSALGSDRSLAFPMRRPARRKEAAFG
jgi:hypothetical protein